MIEVSEYKGCGQEIQDILVPVPLRLDDEIVSQPGQGVAFAIRHGDDVLNAHPKLTWQVDSRLH